MPSRTRPPAMPMAVRVVIGILSSEVRTEILRALAREGELPTIDIAQAAGASVSAAHRHLKYLATAGVVQERRHEGVGRGGIRSTWILDPARVEDLCHQWLEYALDRLPSESS